MQHLQARLGFLNNEHPRDDQQGRWFAAAYEETILLFFQVLFRARQRLLHFSVNLLQSVQDIRASRVEFITFLLDRFVVFESLNVIDSFCPSSIDE